MKIFENGEKFCKYFLRVYSLNMKLIYIFIHIKDSLKKKVMLKVQNDDFLRGKYIFLLIYNWNIGCLVMIHFGYIFFITNNRNILIRYILLLWSKKKNYYFYFYLLCKWVKFYAKNIVGITTTYVTDTCFWSRLYIVYFYIQLYYGNN